MGLAALANETETIEGSAVSVSLSGHLALTNLKGRYCYPWVQLRTLRLEDLGEIAILQIWEGKEQGLECRTTSLQNPYSFWPTFILINWPCIYFTLAQRDFHLCSQCPFSWFKLNSNFVSSGERICQTNLRWESEEVSLGKSDGALSMWWDSAEGRICTTSINLQNSHILIHWWNIHSFNTLLLDYCVVPIQALGIQ